MKTHALRYISNNTTMLSPSYLGAVWFHSPVVASLQHLLELIATHSLW